MAKVFEETSGASVLPGNAAEGLSLTDDSGCTAAATVTYNPMLKSEGQTRQIGDSGSTGENSTTTTDGKKKQVSISKLFSYSDKQDKILMAIGILAACVYASTMPYFLVNFGETLDELGERSASIDPNPPSVVDSVETFAIEFAVIGAVAGLAGFTFVTVWSIAGERQALRIRRAYVKAILKQDVGWFDEHPAGQLPTAVTSNMAKVQDGMGRKIGDIVSNGLGGIALLITALYINWELGLVIIACVPFVGGSVALLSKLTSSSTTASTEHYGKAGGVATEVLSGIRTVASLTSEGMELKRYDGHLQGAYVAGVKEGIATGFSTGLLFLTFYITYGLAFWFGTKQVADGGDRTGGDVLAAIFAVLMGAMYFGQTSPGFLALGIARAAAVEVFETTDRVPPIDSSSEEGLKPSSVKGHIEFKGLEFCYPARPDDVVFNSLSLDVEVGKTLALVGPSGGGKSTITKLLLRFYDPTRGSVALDGRDIKTLNVAWYRNQIGYVGQEPILFGGSIATNIANGKSGATHEEVVAAAKAANAHSFIKSFPNGYDTTVGDGGFQLSGGQKQRIAIARAIVNDPAILLLDEATSALDSESEKIVQAALDNLHKEKARTTVVIAHRLSTIQNADKIAVIDKGVVESGTHAELLAKNGVYAMLCSLQGGKAAEHEHDDVEFGRQKSMSGSRGGRESSLSSHLLRRQSSTGTSFGDGGKKLDAASGAISNKDAQEEEILPVPPRKRLWALNKKEWPWLVLGMLGAIVAGATAPTEGVFIANAQANLYLVDKDELRRIGNWWALGFVGLAMCALVGRLALETGFGVAGERLTRSLRNMAFTAMVRHDIAWFDKDETAVGVLTNRLEAEASMVRKAAGSNLAHATYLFMTLVLGSILGLAFAWQIGLLAMAMIPLIAVAGVIQMSMLNGGYGDDEGLDGGSRAATLLSSSLQGMTTVTAFNMQQRLTKEYEQASEVSLDKRRTRGLIAGAGFGYSQAIIFWAFSLLFYVGAVLVDDGSVNYKDFFTAMFAVMFGAFGVGQMSNDLADAGKGEQAAAKIFRLTDEVLINDPLSEEGARPGNTTGAISFKNIFFAYPTRPGMQIYGSDKYPAGFNLEVKAGETVALVGPSGAGKSTCMGLLLRFYEPSKGLVMIDGRDIKEVNVKWLRMQIGYVGQEPVLFQGTILENIRKGAPDASVELIQEAAKAANAHDFIMSFNEGYSTEVGEKSALLSGGQKQRIAIARAILKDPPIILLDEATSALDNESEKQVQEALDQLQAKQKRTTLTVAHRLTTIRNSDKIAVLNEGGVQEMGTHDELLALKGMYSMLWHQQTDKLGKGRS